MRGRGVRQRLDDADGFITEMPDNGGHPRHASQSLPRRRHGSCMRLPARQRDLSSRLSTTKKLSISADRQSAGMRGGQEHRGRTLYPRNRAFERFSRLSREAGSSARADEIYSAEDGSDGRGRGPQRPRGTERSVPAANWRSSAVPRRRTLARQTAYGPQRPRIQPELLIHVRTISQNTNRVVELENTKSFRTRRRTTLRCSDRRAVSDGRYLTGPPTARTRPS